MIATVWKIGWLNLLRDRPALALTFVVPLLFFSIFAAVFGSMDRDGIGSVRVGLVFASGAAQTAADDALARLLAADERIELESGVDRDRGLRWIRDGRLTALVVVPRDLGGALSAAAAAGETPPRLEILVDRRANPIAAGVVEGALRGAVFRLWMEARFPPIGRELELPVELAVTDVVEADGGGSRQSISFFAAGIGVMFLLFAVSGRGSLLIEERESGILARMLTCGIGLTPLLAGRWLYLASLGLVQVTVMFVWGSMVFGLELWSARLLTGFLLMTVVTAAAAAALGLLLSVVCRTRAQLNGVAVVLVLAMSALGGSLFPRFLMPEGLRRLGLVTFNAWALDGYQKVFWYRAPLIELWPQLAVLCGVALVLLVIARFAAGRSVLGAAL